MVRIVKDRRVTIAASVLLFLAPISALPAESMISEPLFAEDSALEMEFEVDFSSICRNPERGECGDLPATIYYTDDDGARVRIDVRLRTRGRWRRETSNCAFPALFVYFDPLQIVGTVFENQTMLPFTTHCQHYDKHYHRYTLLEYLAHRYYRLLTDASLKVRLTRSTFRDQGASRQYERYGFFTEHFQSGATRIGAEFIEVDRLDPREADATELATLSVFQYLIGNLDWSVPESHNIALFRHGNGTVFAIPYDFDYSGLVNAEYAEPPDFLHLRTVRSRKFRGFCWPGMDWDGIFSRFVAIRPEMIRLLEDLPGLGRGRVRDTTWYLNRFYETIESPRKRQRAIIDACRQLPPVAPD
jgi:hypothetical protein